MDFKELKTKSEKELRTMLKEQKEELRDLRFKAANRKLKAVTEVRKTRVLIARILTLLNVK